MLRKDEATMGSVKGGFLDGTPPKTSFVFGLVSGVAVVLVFTFLFGGAVISSNTSGAGAADTAAVAPTPAPVAAPVPAAAGAPPEVTEDDYIRGDVDAELTIIEYSDYECPFCQRFHPTMTQIMEEYAGKVRWVFRHFPLTSIHPQATPAAIAAECAGELGGNDGFWGMTDALFENQSTLGRATFERLAGEIGLNANQFSTCLDSGKYDQKVADQQRAGAAAGVTGTPGSFIVDAQGNSQLIPGALPYAQIKAAIDAAL